MANIAKSVAVRINGAHAKIVSHYSTALDHANEAGKLLILAKKATGHGGWAAWLKVNFDASASTAETYMGIADDWPAIQQKRSTVPFLSIRQAKLLSKPKTVKEQMPDPQLQPRSEATCNQMPETDDEPIDVDSEPVDEPGAEPTAYCQTCKTEKPYDDDGDCRACKEPGIGPATVPEPPDPDVDDEAIVEPEAAEPEPSVINGMLNRCDTMWSDAAIRTGLSREVLGDMIEARLREWMKS